MDKVDAAILGSGNIGTDLLKKILCNSKVLNPAFFVGIDSKSEGLRRAKKLNIPTTDKGLDGLLAAPEFKNIKIVFDATSAKAHLDAAKKLKKHGKIVIDLTPAAVGPYCVPIVNLDALPSADNVNMVTCGGQATIPVVAAVSRVAKVKYAEIVAMIASKSAGPGTRANIDEFTQTTARALEKVGGAAKGKAIIVLNPAEPPMMMRNTVYCIVPAVKNGQSEKIKKSVREMAKKVAEYVPGYKIVNGPEIHEIPDGPHKGASLVTTFLEVTGNGDFLPRYAGNLDIMTSAAIACGEKIALKITAGSRT